MSLSFKLFSMQHLQSTGLIAKRHLRTTGMDLSMKSKSARYFSNKNVCKMLINQTAWFVVWTYLWNLVLCTLSIIVIFKIPVRSWFINKTERLAFITAVLFGVSYTWRTLRIISKFFTFAEVMTFWKGTHCCVGT